MFWYEHIFGVLAVITCVGIIPTALIGICCVILAGRMEDKL